MEKIKTRVKTLTIYIFMDDSGKLTSKERVSVFAGIAFTDQYEKDKFNRKHKKIINDIKCSYCENETKIPICKGDQCPEIKSYNIKKGDRRRIINLCKQHHTYGVIIDNTRVYPNILSSKASKGRYTDYAQKMIIKKIVNDFISNGTIDPNEDLNLIIRIDQQSTKSNGYYCLEDSIDEELAKGIYNFNYNMMHKPIIYGKLNVDVEYLDSKKVYSIQASDIIAGRVRNIALHSNSNVEKNQRLNSFLKTKIILP